jgi:hypothetical protein
MRQLPDLLNATPSKAGQAYSHTFIPWHCGDFKNKHMKNKTRLKIILGLFLNEERQFLLTSLQVHSLNF